MRADDHRHQLTEAQKAHRRTIALHEAAHLVLAYRLGIGCLRTFVRVPGISPKIVGGARGEDGGVATLEFNREQTAIICIAGALMEYLMHPADDPADAFDASLQPAGVDWHIFEKWAEEVGEKAAGEVLLRVAATLVTYWDMLDGVAALMLNLGQRDGVARTARLRAIYTWMESGKWLHRTATVPLPPLDLAKLEGARLY